MYTILREIYGCRSIGDLSSGLNDYSVAPFNALQSLCKVNYKPTLAFKVNFSTIRYRKPTILILDRCIRVKFRNVQG